MKLNKAEENELYRVRRLAVMAKLDFVINDEGTFNLLIKNKRKNVLAYFNTIHEAYMFLDGYLAAKQD